VRYRDSPNWLNMEAPAIAEQGNRKRVMRELRHDIYRSETLRQNPLEQSIFT
jgi:hypothetical protein